MKYKEQGDEKLVEQVKEIVKKAPKKKRGKNPHGLNFADKQASFESFILRGLSEYRAMDAIGMARNTIDQYKIRYPEYKERLKELKQQAKTDMANTAESAMWDMVRTGITPVGEMNSSEYRKATEFFLTHFKEIKGDYTKTEHKIIETIKEVDATTLQKVNEVFQVVDVESEEDD